MALTCPRCGTDVPNEAQYCPYCSLPKPRRGFTDAAEAKLEETDSDERPKSPVAVAFKRANKESNKLPKKGDGHDFFGVAFKRAKSESNKPAKRSASRPDKPPRKLRLSVLGVASLVALFSAGVYIFIVPLVYSDQAEPKTVLTALDNLKRLPSSEPEITIDARLLRELETSRRVGNLAAYKGWTVRPIKGTKARVVFAFSYVEVGDVHQSAEWIADLTHNTFTPQTELAATVHGKQ
jgi:hypothetical protein